MQSALLWAAPRRQQRKACIRVQSWILTLLPAWQDIAPFADPKIELEQFPTGAHLASRLLFTVQGLHAAACGGTSRHHWRSVTSVCLVSGTGQGSKACAPPGFGVSRLLPPQGCMWWPEAVRRAAQLSASLRTWAGLRL